MSTATRDARVQQASSSARRLRRAIDDVTREATFEELDIDSLDLAELAQVVEDEYGVEITGDDVEGRQDRRRRRSTSWSRKRRDDAAASSSPASARSRRWASARATLHERWVAGESGIQDGEGALRRVRPDRHLTPKEARRADRFTQLAHRGRRRGAGRTPAGPTACPTTRTAIGCVIGTGIGGMATIEDAARHAARARADAGVAARRPADDGQRAPRRGRMRHGLPGPALRRRVGLRRRRARDRHRACGSIQYGDADAVVTGGARGGAHAALARRLRLDGRAVGVRHLAPVRPPPRRLRHGRGRGRPRARGRARRAEARGARDPRRAARLRRDRRRPPPHRARAAGPGRDEGDPAGARRRRAGARGRRLRQRARHLDAAQRPRRDRRDQGGARRARRATCRSPRRSRRSGTCSARPAPWRPIATVLALRERVAPPTLGYEEPEEGLDLDYVPGRRAARSTRPTAPAAGRAVELVRLRRPQRRAVPGGCGMTVRVARPAPRAPHAASSAWRPCAIRELRRRSAPPRSPAGWRPRGRRATA